MFFIGICFGLFGEKLVFVFREENVLCSFLLFFLNLGVYYVFVFVLKFLYGLYFWNLYCYCS